ncbi:nascent polypeptide-associated complex subunit alpha, muscle-specific form-like isoform X2 [Haliotis cracherodii]|uniref:nascent polypeptide-associated complex subunit alpha, muscle-specific form-like isoform X2 n=1 Tax=Haliotis cracherodii TaxID=6455 RepID=UPI0039E8A574
MADRKTSEHFHNLKDGSDQKRPMVIQSAPRHHHDTFTDSGSNGVKDTEKHRHKESKKSHHSKSQPKLQPSGSESQVYTLHESSPFDSTKYSTSTSSMEAAHHKKRLKTSLPKPKHELDVHRHDLSDVMPKSQASQSTLEALMARSPVSQDRVIPISNRASPVGSFIPSPPHTKSASLSRDISPSRITQQVVSALSESYPPPLLHSALTGMLTQSPASSPSPPNRTVVRNAPPSREQEHHGRLSSQTIRHLQESQLQRKAQTIRQPGVHIQTRLPPGTQAAEGPVDHITFRSVSPKSRQVSHEPHVERVVFRSVSPKGIQRSHIPAGERGALPFRSVSPKSVQSSHIVEGGVPFRSVSPRRSHVPHPGRQVKEEPRGFVVEGPNTALSANSSAPQQTDLNMPVYTSSVLNNVPNTVVYSQSFGRAPPISSAGTVSLSGSIPSVREGPPGVRIVHSSEGLQKVIVSLGENPGPMSRELAERLEAELRSHHQSHRRTPSPVPSSSTRPAKEHIPPSSYARHPSSSPLTIHKTPSPSHAGHRTHGHSSSPQTIHRTPSPSHAGHRTQGHISPVSHAQGKVSPVPTRNIVSSAHRIHGHVSPGPHSQDKGPVLTQPLGRFSPSPTSAYRGHVSPVQTPEQQRMGSSPPPAHKHPELPPTCRSRQPAVDLTKTHHRYANECIPSPAQRYPDMPSVLPSSIAHSSTQEARSVNVLFSQAQGQVSVTPRQHPQEGQQGSKKDRKTDIHHDTQPTFQPASQGQPYSTAGETQLASRLATSQTKPLPPSHINPFTFPVKMMVTTHAPAPIPSYTVNSSSHQPEQRTPLTAPFYPRSTSDISDLQRKTEKENMNDMPRLVPELPLVKKEENSGSFTGFNHVNESPQCEASSSLSPFNMRLQNLANFPVNNTTYRSAYRAQSVAVQRAKACSITSAAKSLDILRQNLQRSLNKELDVIVQNYVEKFFKPAVSNIRLNNGQNAVSDDHIHAVCRQMLEEAKKMYVSEPRRSVTPVRDDTDTVSENGSNCGRRTMGTVRRRRPSDSNSEAGSDISQPKKKRKGRPPLHQSGRGTPLKSIKPNEPVRREGPKWDPERIVTETKFVMGARANKALGLGATRGRLYIKHPDIFKYSGDQDDKAWLYEHHLMPATGGKAYMLMVEDIQDLSRTDEYRDSPNLLMDELYGFTVPDWILAKMKIQMNAMRTDVSRAKFHRSRSGTPTDMTAYREMEEEPPKALPFSNFSDNTSTYPTSKSDIQVFQNYEISPSAGDDMEFLSTADNDSAAPDLSPFNVTGGFDDTNSPSPEVDNLDDPTFVLK